MGKNCAMELTLQDALAIPGDVLFRELDDEAVLLNLKTGIYFGLNPIALQVWRLICRGLPLTQVHDTLVREYDVDGDIAARDLLDLCRQLCAHGLGAVVPAPLL